jgi:uncharacterized protein YndB with AHSA1/START domain
MSLVDRTDPSRTDSIEFEFELSHSPEKVWRALTDPALLAKWLLPVSGFALEPGSAFTFQAPPQPEWDGRVEGRLIEADVGRKLSYAWIVGEIDTVVTFTLAPTPTGTHLSVAQTGFTPDQRRNRGGARYGWKMMGEKLIGLLERSA